MQDITLNHFLVGAGITAVIAEMVIGAATGFDLFVLGGILIMSGTAGFVTDSTTIPMLLVPLLSILYIFGGRRLIRQRLTVSTRATNADALLGKKGVVTKQIGKNQPGRIKVDGEEWRAQADVRIDESDSVVVESVSGVTLSVRPQQS